MLKSNAQLFWKDCRSMKKRHMRKPSLITDKIHNLVRLKHVSLTRFHWQDFWTHVDITNLQESVYHFLSYTIHLHIRIMPYRAGASDYFGSRLIYWLFFDKSQLIMYATMHDCFFKAKLCFDTLWHPTTVKGILVHQRKIKFTYTIQSPPGQ